MVANEILRHSRSDATINRDWMYHPPVHGFAQFHKSVVDNDIYGTSFNRACVITAGRWCSNSAACEGGIRQVTREPRDRNRNVWPQMYVDILYGSSDMNNCPYMFVVWNSTFLSNIVLEIDTTVKP
jgi:hypothetical protein